MNTSVLPYTGLLKWQNFGGLLCGRHQKIQHCCSSSMHYLILRTLLQRVSPSWDSGEGSFSFMLLFRRTSLVGIAAKIINPPTDWSYDFRDWLLFMCNVLFFLSPCSGLCISDISTAAVLHWMLYILRSHFKLLKKKRSLSCMLEREKGCGPISALMRFYLLFRVPVLWSAADCLYIILYFYLSD